MSIAGHVHAVAWPLRWHSLILNFDCMCHASNMNLINPLAKVQHVVAKAKRTLESNNPVMYELKQLCGPKLLEKSKSNPKKPVEPEGGFIAQFSASRRLKLHTSTLHAQVRMMLHSRYVSTPRALWRWICKDCRHLLLLRNSWKLSSVISRAGLQHVSTMPSSIRNSSGSSSSRDKDRQTNTGAA